MTGGWCSTPWNKAVYSGKRANSMQPQLPWSVAQQSAAERQHCPSICPKLSQQQRHGGAASALLVARPGLACGPAEASSDVQCSKIQGRRSA